MSRSEDMSAAATTPAWLWPRVFLPFALGYYLSYALRTVNAVIAPELTRELGLTAADLGLLTSAYFLTFGAIQIPLGMLLDHYGPRRVEASLLLFAAAGAALFAAGRSLPELALARGLIGLGVSACLMASFKNFHQWFPAERQPSLTASIMVAGSIGALTASVPLEMALPGIGWRGVFWLLAGLTLVVAALIMSVPERGHGVARESMGQQLQGVTRVLASPQFWRYAPQTCFVVGGFMALQSLWAVPWLMTVGGHSRPLAAQHLFYLNLALLAGYLTLALFATRLARRGIPPIALLAGGMLFTVLSGLAVLVEAGPSLLLWSLLGLSVCVGNLAYPLLTAHYPPHLAGRVNTSLNLAAFVGAFSIQWGFGALVDLLQARGASAADAFRGAMGLLLAAQGAAFLWFAAGLRKRAAAAVAP